MRQVRLHSGAADGFLMGRIAGGPYRPRKFETRGRPHQTQIVRASCE